MALTRTNLVKSLRTLDGTRSFIFPSVCAWTQSLISLAAFTESAKLTALASLAKLF